MLISMQKLLLLSLVCLIVATLKTLDSAGDTMVMIVCVPVSLDAKFLMLHRMHLAAAVFDEPIESFRCYKLRQSNPELYPY